jgi:hypothetical protein
MTQAQESLIETPQSSEGSPGIDKKAADQENRKSVAGKGSTGSKKGRVANKDKVPSGRKGVPSFTPKENKFLKGMVTEVIPGKKTKQELALEIYDTDDPATASAIASENLNKPKFQAVLADAFDKAGITPQSMADVLREAMTAKKTASFQGFVIPSDEPDHSVRVSAVKAAASLIGANDGDKDTPNIFNFNTGAQTFINKVEAPKQ